MSDASWLPTAAHDALKARADLLRSVRAFFDGRGVMEVSTPLLAAHGVSDEHIDAIEVPGHGWLQTSPEYHMKRLLAAGSGPIYQIARAFRHGEAGARHNPEFTLLEWYRPGFDLEALVDECLALLGPLCGAGAERRRFRELFAAVTGLDPLTAPAADLAARAERAGAPTGLSGPQAVDYLMAVDVEPALDPAVLTVVTDFPGWAAALAQTTEDGDGARVARRFEIYHRGLELANGYQELLDADEQARRFERDNEKRRAAGKRTMTPDPYLLAALAAGLPPCSGVALGLERLQMVLSGAERIDRVWPFPVERA
ncbi:EF-P lysine aminoacylase EpmA [Alloalcanivorax profundimaris]|uniref:EF-P lysine aminoacylase EpmA n=1 Tax=Alloalcanivorax profundimaris TaxID=2735259 RepID=UPI0018891646|nr:EF-P lysine aminoacylase EpmA [Alloalcanivorax profundimaris]MBF1802433.1 EF-P lysine aminoacylase GenX [Alloalcanivorax profundimaris]